MNPRIRTAFLISVVVSGLALMSGCATSGPKFSKVENIPEGKGLIYIYRPSAFKGGAIFYDVNVNDKVVTTLRSGGYFPHFANAGENEVWAKTEAKSSVTLDVKPGKTYYVKGETRIGFLMGRPELTIQPPEVGAAEVAECNLLVPDPPEK